MNQNIKELSDTLHTLYEQLMQSDPWDDGYGEVSAIHEFLLKTLRDKAHKSYDEFTTYLIQASEDILQTWSSSSSQLSKWAQHLKPVFEKIELIIQHAVPLLTLI